MKQEFAIQIGTGHVMYGILNLPEDPRPSAPAIVFLNAGLLHRPGPFRMYLEISRCLAKIGFTVLRLDQAGKGDSDRRAGLEVIESAKVDVQMVSEFMANRGIENLVLAGLCSGADDSLWIIEERDNVKGLIMFDGYSGKTPKYYLTKFLKKLGTITPSKVAEKITFGFTSKGKSEDVGDTGELEDLRNFPDMDQGRLMYRRMVQDQVDVLSIFTGDVGHYYNYSGQLRDYIGADEFGDCIKEVYLPHAKHTYPFPQHRKELITRVVSWCDETFKASG